MWPQGDPLCLFVYLFSFVSLFACLLVCSLVRSFACSFLFFPLFCSFSLSFVLSFYALFLSLFFSLSVFPYFSYSFIHPFFRSNFSLIALSFVVALIFISSFFFFSSNHQGGDNSPRLLKSIRPLNLPILTDHSHETQEEHGIPQESEPNGPGAEYGADEAALGGGESWKKIDANELKHIGSFGDQRLVFTYDAGTSTSINHV